MKDDGIFRLYEDRPGEGSYSCTLFMDAAITYHSTINDLTVQYADHILTLVKHLFKDNVEVHLSPGPDGVRIKVHTYPPFNDAGFTLFLSYNRIPDEGGHTWH